MPRFVYIAGERVENLGHTFEGGKPTEVTDERAVRKLRAHPHFSEVIDGVEVVMAPVVKRRGRPPKAK